MHAFLRVNEIKTPWPNDLEKQNAISRSVRPETRLLAIRGELVFSKYI